jgi:hypothetical protein
MIGQLHALAAMPLKRIAPWTHWIGGWVDHTTGLDNIEKLKFLTLSGQELRPLCRPACKQSLYRLRYGGSPSPDADCS